MDKETERYVKRNWMVRPDLLPEHKKNFRKNSYKIKRPEMWLETVFCGTYAYELLRIFYPDGSSEFLTLNTYHDNGNILIDVASTWSNSCGNDWYPVDYAVDGKRHDTRATLLGVL
jgi:hypothetical protein